MAEKVNTGGLTEIRYSKGYKTPRDKELENKIDSAYEKYYARKRKEKIIWISVIIMLIILVIAYLIFKF